MIDRETAWEILREHTKSESLRKHALAVEIVMRGYARKFGADEEVWGIVGMLHDFDYELYPEIPDHPTKGSAILQERGFPDELIRAIASHVDQLGLPREDPLSRTLFACDELAGFLVAAALVRPGRSILGMEARSVRKKLKDKAFARSVCRDDIYRGAVEMGVDLDEHITFCIQALSESAGLLGLDGTAVQPSEPRASEGVEK